MITLRRSLLFLLLAAALLWAPTPADAKPCRKLCKAELANCATECAQATKPKRCRMACRKELLTGCRAFEDLRCMSSTTTTTLPPCTDDCPAVPIGYLPAQHLVSSDVERTYALFVPTDYDPDRVYSLVFAFHGDGGTGDGLRTGLGLEAVANGEAIFVYPDATVESGRSFVLDTHLNANPDMQFFLDLVGALSHTYRIGRVFATGHSRGGYFVNFLNCTFGATRLAAIAANSGSGPYGEDSDFDENGHYRCPAAPAAALMIHGVADQVVIIADAEYSRSQWVWGNHCVDATTAVSPSPCVTHNQCDATKPVEWCAIPGLGHGLWSNAPTTIWGFFTRVRDALPPMQ